MQLKVEIDRSLNKVYDLLKYENYYDRKVTTLVREGYQILNLANIIGPARQYRYRDEFQNMWLVGDNKFFFLIYNVQENTAYVKNEELLRSAEDCLQHVWKIKPLLCINSFCINYDKVDVATVQPIFHLFAEKDVEDMSNSNPSEVEISGNDTQYLVTRTLKAGEFC